LTLNALRVEAGLVRTRVKNALTLRTTLRMTIFVRNFIPQVPKRLYCQEPEACARLAVQGHEVQECIHSSHHVLLCPRLPGNW
jgi:hypothetical protein